MNEDKKPLEVVFAPGCFDSFEGSQEELDEIMAEILRMAESGELTQRSSSVDLDELYDLEPERAQQIIQALDNIDAPIRNLQ